MTKEKKNFKLSKLNKKKIFFDFVLPAIIFFVLVGTPIGTTAQTFLHQAWLWIGINEPSYTEDKTTLQRDKADMEFRLVDFDGRVYPMSKFEGKVIILNFWATWCGPCRAELPSLDKFYQKIDDNSVAMVTVALDNSVATIRYYLDDNLFSFPTFIPYRQNKPSYDYRSLPTTYIIDRNGYVRKVLRTTTNFNSKNFINYIKKLEKESLG